MKEVRNTPIPQELETFIAQHSYKWKDTERLSFYDLLMQFVCRAGRSNAEIAADAQISRSTVTRLLSRQTASSTRDTAIAIAFALKLGAEELKLLLKARDIHDGFPADRKDYVILYQVMNGRYSVTELNELLDAYGCTLIGSNALEN